MPPCSLRRLLSGSDLGSHFGCKVVHLLYNSLAHYIQGPDFDGDAIEYQGRKYYFCDPTGPANSSEIGRLPEEFIGQEYEIIGQFN